MYSCIHSTGPYWGRCARTRDIQDEKEQAKFLTSKSNRVSWLMKEGSLKKVIFGTEIWLRSRNYLVQIWSYMTVFCLKSSSSFPLQREKSKLLTMAFKTLFFWEFSLLNFHRLCFSLSFPFQFKIPPLQTFSLKK